MRMEEEMDSYFPSNICAKGNETKSAEIHIQLTDILVPSRQSLNYIPVKASYQ